MKIIDTHTHTFPDHIAATAIAKLEKKGNIKAAGDGTRAGLLAEMASEGVDMSVVAPVATSPEQVHSINMKSAQVKDDRLPAFGAMHPDFAEFVQELDFIQSIELKGVKLHPEYQRFKVNDRRLFPLYEELQSRSMIVLFHAGEDIGFPPPYGGCPSEIAKVCDNFPKLKVIAAHMGGFRLWQDVLDVLAGRENIWFDTAMCADYMPDNLFDSIVGKHGHERILMATDWPWQSQQQIIDWLKKKKLKPNELEAILGGNAEKLLGI